MRCAVGFLFSRLEAVLEQDAAVEDQMVCAAVAGVHAEIAHAHELEARRGLRCAAFAFGIVFLCLFDKRGFDLAAGQNRQGIRGSGSRGSPCPGRRAERQRRGCRTDEPRRQRQSSQSTQWMVAPLTLRPSAGSPPRESGSYSRKISVDAAVFVLDLQPVQVIRYAPFRRHSGPSGIQTLILGHGRLQGSRPPRSTDGGRT